MSRSTLRLFSLLFIGLAAACEKVPLLAPVESTVTLSVSSTSVALNGSVEVIATVIEPAGTPVHNGTLVTFVASDGTLEPREATTNNGLARTVFRAGAKSGIATIRAFSGSSAADVVEVLVGAAAAQDIALRADPSNVSTNGGQVQVIAVVTDDSGNAIAGVPVVFSVDAGVLGANSATTDAQGEARVTLTTNRDTVVTARAGAAQAQLTVRAVNVPTVSIQTSANPTAGVPVTFTLTANGGSSANPITNVTLDFGDGTPPAALGPVPTGGSIATSHVYRQASAYTVRATSRDAQGFEGTTSTVVNVSRSTPQPSLSVTPSSPQAGQVVTATITIANPQSIQVQSAVIHWGNGTQTSLGSPQSGTVTASTTYGSAGTYTIRVEIVDITGATATAQTSIVVQGGAAIEVDFNVTPQSIFSPATVFTVTQPASSADVSLYTWTFGDGVVQSTTSRTIEHRYPVSGNYQVTLRVTTTTGRTADRTKTVVIP